MKSLVLFSYLTLITISISSCNRYVDKVKREKKIPVWQGNFTYYPDSNVLFFKVKVGLHRGIGTEVKYPKPYYIKLPKQLIDWKIGSDNFVINYNDRQVFAFYMDLFDDIKVKDTAYIPTIEDVENFRKYLGADKSKYNLYNIPMLKDRKHYIIYKGDAILLLYNILPSNYDRFNEAGNSFKFL